MSTTSDTTLSTVVPGERSSSPFEVDQIKPRGIKQPYTSISNLPELPSHIKSTAQRKRIEIEELKTKVKLLGSKAVVSGDFERLTVILDNIGSAGDHDIINLRNEVGYNMLHYAVAYGHEKVVKLLLDRGADSDCCTEDLLLETPLILAVKYAHNAKESLTILDLLLKEEVNVNSQNSNGDTALLLATDLQNVIVFEQLIGIENIEIEKSNLKGDTPLTIAASHDNVEMIKILLAHRANIYAKNKLGHNSIHVACINGCSNVLQVILKEHSVECNRMVRERDLQGNTPLLLAKTAPCNASILVEHLMSINADVRVSDHYGNKLLHLYNKIDDVDLCEKIIGKHPDLLEVTNQNNEKPLHIATKLGHKDTAKLFIEKDADMLSKDCQGFTPCMVAIATGQKDILKIMLDHNPDILEVHNPPIAFWAIENDYVTLLQAIWEQDHQALVDPGRFGIPSTFLHITARFGAVELTKKLLAIRQTRARVNDKDMKNQSPVHIAAEKGHLQIVILLCEAEATTSIGDHNGNTPLHHACSNGHIQIVKYLIQNESSLTNRNAMDYDAVACAAAEGHDDILHYLLSLGESPNGNDKTCPIILASAKGHIKCVKMLLNHQSIDISKTNNAGYNCLAEAISNGHKELTFAILSSKHWKIAMRMSTEDGITPMRLMVQKMPDAAELVLHKSITFLTKEEHGHSTISEIEYSYEFIEDFQDHQGECYHQLSSFLFPKRPPFVLENIVAMGTVENGVTSSGTLVNKASDTSPVNAYKLGKRNNDWGPKTFKKKNHVIKLMVENKRTHLLQHPLVAELLSHKWHIFGYPSFVLKLSIFVIFLAILTTFALVLPLPDDNDFCERSQFIEGNNNTGLSEMTPDNSNINEMGFANRTVNCPGSTDVQISLERLRIVLYILTFIGILFELVQLIFQRLRYFLIPHSYMEMILYIVVLLFIQVGSEECWCADAITWQMGAVGCVLAWLNLVYILKRLPFTAIPINMLINILFTFISIALLPLLLIVTFALPFYMLLANPEISTAFEMFPKSCVKTLVMITGEFEFDDIFFSSTISYPFTTYILWIVFIILMPILFNNLLVGLAVGDIQKERDKAVLTKLDLQVELALSVEEVIPIMRRFCYKSSDKFHPTSKPLQKFGRMFNTTFKERLANLKMIENDEKHLNMGKPDIDPLDEMKCLIEKQENEILKLKGMVQEILNSIENPNSGQPSIQSKKVKLHLKRAQLDNASDSNFVFSIDNNALPLLP